MAIQIVKKNDYSAEESSHFRARAHEERQFDPSDHLPPFPKRALIELSNWCNHACVFCTNPRMERKKGFLSLELYQDFLQQSVPLGLEDVGLYTTGEPFFVKNLEDFVRVSKEAGVKYIFLTSNGALATADRVKKVLDAGLSSIKFSFNAGSRETYKLVHGKDDFETVLTNLRWISEYRASSGLDFRIMASSVVTRFTEPEKPRIQELLMPLVDELMFLDVGAQGGQSLDQLGHIESSGTDPFPAEGKAPACSHLWSRLHVTNEGYLSLCCVDYENALTYADLRKTPVKEAWHNQVIEEMRKKQEMQKLHGTLCQNCLYGTQEPVRPISQVGHEDPQKVIVSENADGSKKVFDRIEGLTLLHQ